MKKYIIGIISLLFSFLSVNLLFAATFTQADLTGTWRMNLLRTGFYSDGTTPRNEWMRVRLTIDSFGVVTCLSMSDSTGVIVACPDPFNLTLTMNPSTGVITQTGDHAANVGTDHMTMASNKNFAAGTATYGDGSGYSYQMMIIQKEVAETSYSAADLQDKSIVYHQLEVGATNRWRYGAGTLDGTGNFTITSETTPSGTTGIEDTNSTFSVDSNGVVTISGEGMTTFQGFLSDDKKTLVGTHTDNTTIYKLLIFQITGQTYTDGPLPAGTTSVHQLGTGASHFWIHWTNTLDSNGEMTFTDWVSSPTITAPITTLTNHIDASGTLTISENPSFHGQMSHDGTFTVSTQTGGSTPNFTYMLSVSIRVTYADTALYADFGDVGLYEWSGTTWTRIGTDIPANMVASSTTLYATFSGLGLYEWSGTTWTRIGTDIPANMVASSTTLYATFSGLGLYEWSGTTWTRIGTDIPANMVASSTTLYATFSGLGLYEWSGTTWTRIGTDIPANMVASSTTLYATFSGLGLYEWSGTTWTRIGTDIPANMVAGL